ncbi:MAG TPA: class I SAM-dependent methyltransferase [Candidatus Binatia bacterium]|nr:class I SAM-dependent methyltransferase [Candidatus Binatia bacterium]
MTRDADFRAAQARRFAAADPAHFAWQVGGPGFAPLEAELLAPVRAAFATPYVEIGCGEGANFVHVGGAGLRVGLDAFPAKLAFARRHVPGVAFAGADATALPLRDASVRLVLVRDVLHHLPEPGRAVAEAVRVLAPGGRLFVVEPNGANPLVAAQARVMRAEQGLRASRRAALEAIVRAAPLADVRVEMRQPLPLRRLVLHHRFGLPALGRAARVGRALGRVEAALGRLLPRARWAYIVLSAVKAGQG